MKVSKDQVQDNRERILEGAGRLFRQRGFDGVGVAEVMQTAGLTNGAFYRHFGSKDDLIAQVCERVLGSTLDPWTALSEEDAAATLDTFLRSYLSPLHLKHPDRGCLFATLSGDVARQAAPARRSFTDSLRQRVDALTAVMPGVKKRRRERALAAIASLIGALMLARAVDDAALSRELLAATTARLSRTPEA